MIVQCEHCQTKYRIPDEKVKGKAAKVRCAKCNNTFTVLPESHVPAAAPPVPAAPVTEAAQPAPKPSEPPEPDSEPTGEPEPPPVSPPQPNSSPTAQPQAEPTAQFPDISATVSETEPDHTGPGRGDLPGSPLETYEPPSFPEDADEGRSHRPAHEIDKSVHPSPMQDESPQSEPVEFELETMAHEDSFDPLQTSEMPSAPLGENLQSVSPPLSDEMGWGNISLDSEPDKQIDGEGLGLADGTGYQQPPPPPPIFDEGLDGLSESFQTETEPMPGQASLPSYSPDAVKSKKGGKGLLVILILAVLGAGGYFAYPKVMEIIKPQGDQPVGTLTPDKIQVRSLSREDGNLIYTVRGVVRNDSADSVGMIQVEAQFRNAAGTIVAKSTVFCGNIFDEKEITSGDLGKILADLQNELGQSLSNQGIQPGQDVPFLIVLENPPPDVSKVTVTISGFKETL